MNGYFVYLLRCEDNSLYTGITTDIDRRLQEHTEGSRKSKYTRSHRGRYMVAVWTAPDRSAASRVEYRLKRLTKEQKERIAAEPCRLAESVPESVAWGIQIQSKKA